MAVQIRCDCCELVVNSGDAYFEVNKSDGTTVGVAQYHAAFPGCIQAAQQLPQTISGSMVIRRLQAI